MNIHGAHLFRNKRKIILPFFIGTFQLSRNDSAINLVHEIACHLPCYESVAVVLVYLILKSLRLRIRDTVVFTLREVFSYNE